MSVIVVTVHGTNDGAETDSGEQWWQRASGFCRRFQSLAAGRSIDLDVRPFHWDGANSDVARRQAGQRLAGMLRRALREGGNVSVVGHSHGGNVIAYALDDPWLERAYHRGALRVVTVGTPFFEDRRRWVSTVNELAVRAILSIVALGVTALGLWLAGATDAVWPMGQRLRLGIEVAVSEVERIATDARDGAWQGVESIAEAALYVEPVVRWMFREPAQVIGLGVIAMALVLGPFLLRMLMTLSARGIDLVARPNGRPTWRSVAHPSDEAIALLIATPRTRLNPMTSEGMARSVRRLVPLIAIVTAVLAIALIWLNGPSYLRALPERIAQQSEAGMMELAWREAMASEEGAVSLPHRWSSEEGAFIVAQEDLARASGNDPARMASLQALVEEANAYSEQVEAIIREGQYTSSAMLSDLMPVFLVVLTIIALLLISFVQLVIVALSPAIGQAMSYFANRSVTGAMTGAALGEDGDYALRKVSSSPPARFAAHDVRLSEATAEQMYVDADRNAGESLRRLRRSIDTSPERTTGDAFGDLLSHISWRELIHTSYFECDEMVEIVLDGVIPDRSTASA
jgi:hypothetical protein